MTCHICGQIEGKPESDLLHNMSNDLFYKRRVILETDHFAVIPSLGPLGDGHVLICPRHHFRSTLAVPVEHADEYAGIVFAAESMLRERYGSRVHHFEHGMSPRGRTVCTVGHAHLHLVAADIYVEDRIVRSGTWSSIDHDPICHSDLWLWGEYIYYKSPDGNRIVTTNLDDSFPSQYVRRVFAERSGDPDVWNWRERPNIDKVNLLFEELQIALQGPTGR